MTSCSSPNRHDPDGKAKVLNAADKAKDLLGFGTTVEVVGAEVLEESAVLQHVAGSGENRCSDRADRLLCSSSGSQTLELGLAAQAHWMSVVFSQGAPLRMRVDRRLPALSSFLGPFRLLYPYRFSML
jgi:hypothetical protein